MIPTYLLLEHLKSPNIYKMNNVDWGQVEHEVKRYLTVSKSRKVKYYEVPISFDIEVTSSYDGEEKIAFMYHWQLSIQGNVILGRTWEEFDDCYIKILEMFRPTKEKRVIIYIQNLSYEFQFLSRRLSWFSVFALKKGKPIKAVTVDFVEFRCSYMLSGYSLSKIGENLLKYKIQKMNGDLDYNLIRHSTTPMTDKEIGYCINDVQVVVAYIQETAENDGGFHKIPLTKTGYVREFCREQCFKFDNYRENIKRLAISADDYAQLQRAFAGGFTHANWHYVGRTLYDMDSFDFTSSYPAVMVCEKFPMSKPTQVEITSKEQLSRLLDKFCCLFDVEFEGLDGWHSPDHILSLSKCRRVKNPVLNNGRIISADSLATTITEVDFNSIKRFYKWKRFRVYNFKIFTKAYLPTAFVSSILKLYADKTQLKDVDGKEVEYLKSKGMINAAYGMTVTDIVRDEDTFDDGWVNIKADPDTEIKKYNNSKKRFLYYPWGVWVTAYARANLFKGIYEFKEDYVYSDTDSVKVRNADKHMGFITAYNEAVTIKMEKACRYHGIDVSATRPKTIKGVEKPLGVWDYDGHYTRFKTLGAKRYMTDDGNNIKITVAGLSKKDAMEYIKEKAEKMCVSPFDIFDDDLYIPKGHTGKNIHTYIDYEKSAKVTDYLGNSEIVHEYSAVHMEPADYSLNLEEGFIRLLKGYQFDEL